VQNTDKASTANSAMLRKSREIGKAGLFIPCELHDEHPALAHSPVHAPDNRGTGSYLNSDVYGVSQFGGFGEYMRRQEKKLGWGDKRVRVDIDGKARKEEKDGKSTCGAPQ
jgi:hypothetical protein